MVSHHPITGLYIKASVASTSQLTPVINFQSVSQLTPAAALDKGDHTLQSDTHHFLGFGKTHSFLTLFPAVSDELISQFLQKALNSFYFSFLVKKGWS